MNGPTVLPPSSSNFFINFSGGICFLLALWYIGIYYPHFDFFTVTFLSILAAIVPIVTGEIFFLKVHKRPAVGLQQPGVKDSDRVVTKMFGFYGSLALLSGFYLLCPLYDMDQYHYPLLAMIVLMVLFCLGAVIYIPELDCRMKNPHDKLWHFGSILRGRWKCADKNVVREHLKSVFLRGFFLPVMLLYFFWYIVVFIEGDEDLYFGLLENMADFDGMVILKTLLIIYTFLATIDILFAVIGYIMAFKILDTDIRTTEPTFLGWVVCLICYSPFWEALLITFLFERLYEDTWVDWFANWHPAFIVIWGVCAILAMMFEGFTTLNFGLRFSNLTYRGLISSGLFRFTKHPQYVSKMMNRFFVMVPFMSAFGLVGAFENVAAFTVLCLIYYLRARTEENHLSIYPEYVQYAHAMNNRSLFHGVGKYLPFLVYSEQKALERRLF